MGRTAGLGAGRPMLEGGRLGRVIGRDGAPGVVTGGLGLEGLPGVVTGFSGRPGRLGLSG